MLAPSTPTILTHSRYSLVVPYLEDWFPPVETMGTVTIVKLEDQSTSVREIPAVYFFHLHWMDEETKGPEESKQWLRLVLDSFVDELLGVVDALRWRSKVLNAVIVRTFFKANHFDSKHIGRIMRKNSQIGGSTTPKHWEGFYCNHDVLLPIHRDKWQTLKRVGTVPFSDNVVSIHTTPPCEGEPCGIVQ